MADAYKTEQERSSLAAQVLARALRDRKTVLRKLIVGDALGRRLPDRARQRKKD